jgi:cystathionine gamma-lyase
VAPRFETRAIHAGCPPEERTGSVNVPIFQTATYAQSSPGEQTGFEYARTRNPTRDALEENLASLEGGIGSTCFASGCAATDAVLHTLAPGDHVISVDDVYGGTFRLFDKVHRRHGVDFTFVPAHDAPRAIAEALRPETRLIWLETPTNPLLAVAPIDEVVGAARSVPVLVDNTFGTPYLQRPLEHGATLVLHSMTKYLGGHSDVVAGAVVTQSPEWHDKLRFVQNSVGAVPGPLDCFLVLRGIKTLAVRMDRHCDNAEALAEWLSGHPQVRQVVYPGLSSHPQHAAARRQMKRYGGMITLTLDADLEGSRRFLTGLRVFTLAESLGGVESLAEHPAIMTHASIPADQRKARGIDDGLVRLSVGIEHLSDLRADLEAAFDRLA